MKLLVRLLLLLVVLAALGAGWAWQHYQTFLATPLALPAEGLVYELERGTSLAGLAKDLQSRGILAEPEMLRWHVKLQRPELKIKAGEFRLEPGLGPDALLDVFENGRTVQYGVTFIEGWTFQQMREALEQAEYLEQDLKDLDDAGIMSKLGHDGLHPEGRFFPDTYSFTRGSTASELLTRAMQRMSRELADAWQGREKGLPLKSADQALILASIVEKETGAGHERPEIAGVFIRRLRKGMLLQTDPTVIYGLGDRFKGNLTRKHLREKTPYNTYVISGLPPTPIAMPGGDSLQAAVHPKPGKTLYFVAKGDGTHYFSKTLREHNNAVRKYQLKR